MLVSNLVLFACIMAGAVAGYVLMSVQASRRFKKRDRRIRELERTIQKLKKKNGKLWYDVLKSRKQTGAFESSDLTQTSV